MKTPEDMLTGDVLLAVVQFSYQSRNDKPCRTCSRSYTKDEFSGRFCRVTHNGVSDNGTCGAFTTSKVDDNGEAL
jgi:hypothetical protein